MERALQSCGCNSAMLQFAITVAGHVCCEPRIPKNCRPPPSCASARAHTEHRGRRTRNPRGSSIALAGLHPRRAAPLSRAHTRDSEFDIDIQRQIPLSRTLPSQPPIALYSNPVPAIAIGGSHSARARTHGPEYRVSPVAIGLGGRPTYGVLLHYPPPGTHCIDIAQHEKQKTATLPPAPLGACRY